MPRRRLIGAAIVLPLLVASLLGCRSVESIGPGEGGLTRIQGPSYDQIWDGLQRICNEHFKIVEQDKAKGYIKAGRGVGFATWGEWVGIFLTPTTPTGRVYTLEVVSKKKSAMQITSGSDWEKRVPRELLTYLGLPVPSELR